MATAHPIRLFGLLAVSSAVAAAMLVVAPGASAATSTGPRLTVPKTTMDAALKCTSNLRAGSQAPVLFLHGTTSSSKANWSWNWVKAMNAAGRPHCELDLPHGATRDIQVSAEYVVNAIRVMHQRAGRKISMVGHSQGGMIGRWALKYWPDTRAMVDDYVGLASSNHGSTRGIFLCNLPGGCSAANWQQITGSHFLTALNKGPETFSGISYTVIATRSDQLVAPYTASFLKPATNVTNATVQDLCPEEHPEHFAMAYNNAAWLIGIDALTHLGPARLSRVSRATCGAFAMPSVNRATFFVDVAAALAVTAAYIAAEVHMPAEPALRAYAR